MIRSLTGEIDDIGENWLVVNVHGVGYLVGTPTLQNHFTENSTITLHTYLAVRETALDLYGFPHKTELEMFELLLGIPKIGPKSALQILCQATPSLLAEAAQKNDGVYLHKLSGIGKKTAENITQYLHSKLAQLPTTIITTQDDLTAVQTDAIDALIALGYDTTTARETVLELSNTDATVNSLVTKALKQIQ
ncbi:MAG: Holliday junction branch migration protein RuvA [Candidatus Kaiserbacteria bacterium]|nr:Holliday junction branch migration protein RuvA [Candidatus Kaiserbacteria bacterium]MCB9816475.1 Holliday junction branch migration protein RuvA [Candidatus Nomurabacteria bacterium]